MCRVGYMTMNGAMGKTALLLVILVAGAAYTWNIFFTTMATATSRAHLVALSSTLQQTTMVRPICMLLKKLKPC